MQVASRLCRRFCFFFQAEDGIRDTSVNGVQTCALPIWSNSIWPTPSCGSRTSTGSMPASDLRRAATEIGRASCRERGWIAVGEGALEKKSIGVEGQGVREVKSGEWECGSEGLTCRSQVW